MDWAFSSLKKTGDKNALTDLAISSQMMMKLVTVILWSEIFLNWGNFDHVIVVSML